MAERQRLRLWLRVAFFALFVLAPPLNIFRIDLKLGSMILFGHEWTLGRDALLRGDVDATTAALNLILRGFLPIAAIVGAGVWVSWKYGRLYCGWLCPHFSVVEVINAAMRRAWGRPTLWERAPLPQELPDGRTVRPKTGYWIVAIAAVIGFAFLWALSLLTYLWPPFEVYHDLWHATPTRFEFIFITAATTAFTIEFLLARHLFCRFGCAIGLFQSLVWMANRHAMVVGFDRGRVDACVDCNAACDNACPMRLRPRSSKRHMFTCTQCARCLEACEQVQKPLAAQPLLRWVRHEAALDVSDRNFGRRAEQSASTAPRQDQDPE